MKGLGFHYRLYLALKFTVSSLYPNVLSLVLWSLRNGKYHKVFCPGLIKQNWVRKGTDGDRLIWTGPSQDLGTVPKLHLKSYLDI